MLSKTRFTACFVLAWIVSSIFARSAVAAFNCDNVFDLDPNTVWRHPELSEKPIFRWWLPASGIATVDLLTAEPGSSWIDMRADVCGEKSPSILVIEQSARHLVFAVRSAGPLYLKTDAKPSKSRIVTTFKPTEVFDETFGFGSPGVTAVQTSFFVDGPVLKTEPEILDPDPDGLIEPENQPQERFPNIDLAGAFKTEPEILDPDPDGLVEPVRHRSKMVLNFEHADVFKTEPEILDPDPDGLIEPGRHLVASFLSLDSTGTLKTEPEILDPDPDGLVGSRIHEWNTSRRQVLRFEPICRPTEIDDHGDTPSCATPLALGESVTGELANDWSDDRDVFSFRLEKISTVEIVLVTDASDFSYELSDSNGQRLAIDQQWAAEETSAHLGVTLTPGRYFFHVTGTSGAFAMTTIVSD